MLVQNQRLPEFHAIAIQNKSPITIYQHGACSWITDLFSRAIKWIKELFSCGKKPLATPSITQPPAAPARPIEQLPAIAQLQPGPARLADPVLLEREPPQVLPGPAERPLEQPPRVEIARPAPVLPPIVQRELSDDMRLFIERLDIEQANREIAGFDAQLENARRLFLEQNGEEPNPRLDETREFLETSDARLVALRARVQTLLTVELPPDLVEGLPTWNRVQADRVIALYEQHALHFSNSMVGMLPGQRHWAQIDLDRYQAVLHAIRERRAALELLPAPPAAQPGDPQMAQRPLAQRDQSEIDIMDIDEVKQELERFDAWLAQNRGYYRDQMEIDPQNAHAAEYRGRLETSDARLAALQVRTAQLQAAIVPRNIVENLRNEPIARLRGSIQHNDDNIRHLKERIPELEGEARRSRQLSLDEHYALNRLYKKRLEEMNRPEGQ